MITREDIVVAEAAGREALQRRAGQTATAAQLAQAGLAARKAAASRGIRV